MCRCGLRAVIHFKRVRELQEAISAGTTAFEISSRNSRVAALQTLGQRAGLDLILQQRGADMVTVPAGRQAGSY